jgi:WYL domain
MWARSRTDNADRPAHVQRGTSPRLVEGRVALKGVVLAVGRFGVVCERAVVFAALVVAGERDGGLVRGKGDGDPRLVRARFVTRRKWHASQKFVKLADGAIEMHLRVSPSFEVRNWVLRFGSMATVIEPEGLRKEIAAECAAMNAIYSGDGTAKAVDS